MVLAEGVVDLRRDSPHGPTITAREEVLRLGVLEERVLVPIEELAPIADVRGSAEYRLDAAREIVARAVGTAIGPSEGKVAA